MVMKSPVFRYRRKKFFGPELALCVLRPFPQGDHELHDHDFSELVVVLSGAGWHASTQGNYALRRGDVFVIRRGDRHAYRRTRGLVIVNVIFDLARLRIPAEVLDSMPGYRALFALEPELRQRHGRRGRLTLNEADLAVACDLLENLRHEIERRRPGFVCMATGLFMQLVGHLSRCYAQVRDPQPRALLRLGDVLAKLEKDCVIPLSLAELSSAASMSPSTLGRAFRRAVGVSPIDYVIRRRIQKAAELLTSSDMSIKEIAARTGFADGNYLARQFRRVLGTSPRRYRQRLSEKSAT
jgi:AraC family L-rhamnose operon transcriptional activator RhaR/AraC family L-rhamnose operon regulatory protein RhaS